MFTTVNSFLFFFIPATLLFIAGLIFEDKLIEFEDRIIKFVFKTSKKKKQQKRSNISAVKARKAVNASAAQVHTQCRHHYDKAA